ncbi:MAG TPA: phosphate--AMP phosphotransferase, partial [Candidatus Hydrogenedens sp.]|nr:phosphate--AMP phosphotransferase [Candidatus Hydrogenedens sp.]
MLDTINLDCYLSKDEFKQAIQKWEIDSGRCQRELREKGISTVVLVEGWDTSGKGTLLNRLLLNLDPRGYWVHNIAKTTREERLRPYLWSFWNRLPKYGDIAFFNHSWYWPIVLRAK